MKPIRELGRLGAMGAMGTIGMIRAYQAVLSPLFVAFFGPQAGCRFAPSCSQYALECFQTHSFFRALFLSLKRIGRCQPFHPGGFDPVPGTGQKPSQSYEE